VLLANLSSPAGYRTGPLAFDGDQGNEPGRAAVHAGTPRRKANHTLPERGSVERVYSCRSATIGSTRTARRAGTRHAIAREIAIRLALGGELGHVVRMVLRLGMQMVAVGLIIGVAVSFATNRLLQSELWGHDADRPMTFAGAILVTLAVGAVVEDGIAIARVLGGSVASRVPTCIPSLRA